MTTAHPDVSCGALSDPAITNADIARFHGVSVRTVIRWRASAGIPSTWAPPEPAHGTPRRYGIGCRCRPCKDAHAARARDDYAAKQAITTYAATRRSEPWEPWEDALLRDRGALSAALALSRTYAACLWRARVV